MKKYLVISEFKDMQDAKHRYFVGDKFPREGLQVSEDRIKELSSSNNKRKVPLIKEVATEEPIKRDVPKEVSSEPKEVPLRMKTGVNSSKTTRTKKNKEKA